MTPYVRQGEYENKTLLIIGAGAEQVPGILLAQKLGIFVVAVDGNPRAPGFALADDYGVVSTYDVPGNVQFARTYSGSKRNIDGVMTLASDVPMTVAAVAYALGLPGHTLQTARRASDKLLMKRVFAKNGVPIPEFAPVKNSADIERFVRRHGYPIVVKPVDSRGARGVLRISNKEDLSWAIHTSRSESPSGRVMVEKFLQGPQFSTESVIYDGRIMTTGLSDRNYEYLEKFAPNIIENGGDLPASLNSAQRKRLNALLLRAARSLGIKRGSMKGDVVWTKRGPYIIEVAARLSGGYFATDEVPLSTGVDIVEQVIRIALGLPPQFRMLKPKFTKYVCQRFFFPQGAGTIRNIRGIAKARAIPGVKRLHLYAKVDDVVKKIVSHPSRGGYVMAVATTRAKAQSIARRAVETVRFFIS